MPTRSRIAIQNQDSTVSSIYCHFDGHPYNNGATLVRHYKSRDKVEALIELGNLSGLDDKIETSLAYGRDRGASNQGAVLHESIEDYIASDLEDYGYLFTLENEWICFDGEDKTQINLDEYKVSESDRILVVNITKSFLDKNQLEEVIEKEFGYRYDISANENLLDRAEVEYHVRKHLDGNVNQEYLNALSNLTHGVCPPPNSLGVILNELCERGFIDAGQYFI